MAWTTPKVWTVGEVLTAADMNAQVSDNLSMAASAAKPSVRVYCSTWRHPSAASGNLRAVNYNNASWDYAGMHDVGSSGWKLVVPTGADGKYLVGAGYQHTASTANLRRVGIYAGGTSSGGGSIMLCMSREEYNAGLFSDTITTLSAGVAGSHFSVLAYQNTGANYDVTNWAAWATWDSA